MLFQTQVYLDKKLIHRLHVLNPLTNTDIIGNVLYFMVVAKSTYGSRSETDPAVENLHDVSGAKVARIAAPPSTTAAASKVSAQSNANVIQKTSPTTVVESGIKTQPCTQKMLSSMGPKSPMAQRMPIIQDPILLNRAIHNQDPERIPMISRNSADNTSRSEADEGDRTESPSPFAFDFPSRNDQSVSQQQVASTPPTNTDASLVTSGWTLKSHVSHLLNEQEVDDGREQNPSTPRSHHRKSILSVGRDLGKQMNNLSKRFQGFDAIEDSPDIDLPTTRSPPTLLHQSPHPSPAQQQPPSIANNQPSKRQPEHLTIQTNFGRHHLGSTSASIVENRNKSRGDFQFREVRPPAIFSAYPTTNASAVAKTLRPHRPPILILDPKLLAHRETTPVPAGSITQHGNPITPFQIMSIVPATSRSRRRTLSYINAMVSSGSTSASMDEWEKLVREDRDLSANAASPTQNHPLNPQNNLVNDQLQAQAISSAAGEYDRVKPFGANQIPVVGYPSSPLATNAHRVSAENSPIFSPLPVLSKEEFYDAVLFATDTDFLEQALIRHIFRENAQQPTDSTLFEMTPFTGEESHAETRAIGNVDLPTVCEILCPSRDQMNMYGSTYR